MVDVENVVVPWQASQDMVAGMWAAGLPVALTPWQLRQVPGVTPVWLKEAGIQLFMLWQTSHGCVVTTWPLGFPRAPS